ncbi:MAG TPA: acyl-ACP--UDP-N-acetylglucosamine O-acyltransferase [Burkholderiales bacterium]|nr:acyl-ACP--UDP-N-acetylglucosamine O-acyltransferase [Burkholderiales bacterium]
MEPVIHPTAIIHPGAKLAPDVEVGAYTLIGDEVEIGPGNWIGPHAVIQGPTRIGANNRIFQFVSLGEMPQDKKYGGENTRLEIGNGNTIREFCTFNRGTVQDVGVTRLGDDNWIMAYVHLAHDCQIGSHTIFANNVHLAGHIHVGDYAVLGGFIGIHQFCHIGAHSMLGAGSIVRQDVPPFVTAAGNTAKPRGINSEGLKRRGFTDEVITRIKRAYKMLYKSGLSLEDATQSIAAEMAECPELRPLVEFLEKSQRGVIR